MDAVILAAGNGNRIKSYTDLPKGFIQIESETLIEQSLKILSHFDIDKILIVTGYKANHYEELKSNYSNLDLVYNPDYSQKGSLYSWYRAINWIKNDFLLLESDLLYSESIIGRLLSCPHQNVTLISDISQIHDAVFVETSQNYLINMSKNELTRCSGEFVGISKINKNAYHHFMREASDNPEFLNNGHYDTDGLVTFSKMHPIYCEKLPYIASCEIDDVIHLQNAKNIYPLIRQDSVIFNYKKIKQ